MNDAILRRKAVQQLTGLSASTLYAYIADGLFPAPVRLGRRSVGWPTSSISEWLASRPSTRPAGLTPSASHERIAVEKT